MDPDSKETTGSAAKTWDVEAASYDRSRESDPIYSSCIDMATDVIPEGTPLCLDAGCGTGLSTSCLSARCATVVAVDFSFESLKILQGKGLPNVIVVQADLTALPFKDGAFDACVSANTLQHFRPDGPQQRAISELERVTRRTGTMSVSVHHYSQSKRKAGWIKEGKPGQPGVDYIFRFARSDLVKLLPASVIRGVGYYSLLKIPYLGCRCQNLFGTLAGRIAAYLGYGHMLVAVTNRRHFQARSSDPAP